MNFEPLHLSGAPTRLAHPRPATTAGFLLAFDCTVNEALILAGSETLPAFTIANEHDFIRRPVTVWTPCHCSSPFLIQAEKDYSVAHGINRDELLNSCCIVAEKGEACGYYGLTVVSF